LWGIILHKLHKILETTKHVRKKEILVAKKETENYFSNNRRKNTDYKTIPTLKILKTITISSHSPANCDNSAIPKASPPADNVPNPRLNPLLRVAPAEEHSHHTHREIQKYILNSR
jgi:hypothetical protein